MVEWDISIENNGGGGFIILDFTNLQFRKLHMMLDISCMFPCCIIVNVQVLKLVQLYCLGQLCELDSGGETNKGITTNV